MTTPTKAEIRRELRALSRIAYHIGNVSLAGRIWLRDWLIANIEESRRSQ